MDFQAQLAREYVPEVFLWNFVWLSNLLGGTTCFEVHPVNTVKRYDSCVSSADWVLFSAMESARHNMPFNN
jgi:hypothetical protein